MARHTGSRSDHGFTLIEMLMVIVILGLLAAVVVYAVQNMTHQSATSACRSDFKTVESAQEMYKSQIGVYAATLNQLEAPVVVHGDTLGPWIKDAPGTSHYVIGIDDGSIPGGSAGNITVASVNPAHAAADGNGNCAFA